MSTALACRDESAQDWTEIRRSGGGAYAVKRNQDAGGWKLAFRDQERLEWKVALPKEMHTRVISAVQKSQQQAEAVLLRQLTDMWRRDTMFKSAAQEIILHPAYQQIIGFGDRALPFILDELRNADGEWFWALRMISREDPVADEDRGDYPAMKNAWLEWADCRGL